MSVTAFLPVMTEAEAIRSLHISATALADIGKAAQHYDSVRSGLGIVFRSQIDGALSHIARYPESCQKVNSRYRRAVVKHFPFVVVYRVNDTKIEISGVLPTRSDPVMMSARTT